MASGTEQTASEYIQHHLKNLQVCQDNGEWVWNHCSGNFWAINVDSMFFSLILALFLGWIFRSVARNATTGRPGKLQAFIEIFDNIFGSVREPLVVLDSDLKVVKANHSFYRTFKVKSEGTEMKIHTVSHSEGWKVVRAIRGMGTSKQREILK
jgi:sensor histidine kinase regulating citrate/malate metabolism